MGDTPQDKRCHERAEKAVRELDIGLAVQGIRPAYDSSMCSVDIGTSPEDFVTCEFVITGNEAEDVEELKRLITEQLRQRTT